MVFGRWNLFGDLRNEMNRLQHEMGHAFGRVASGFERYPALDVWQDEDATFVEAELPGLQLDDLEIHVTGNNELSIKGDRKAPEIEEGTWRRREREFGKFTRTFSLPNDVDTEKVEATFRNGVLTIRLPRREESKPRRITVKTN